MLSSTVMIIAPGRNAIVTSGPSASASKVLVSGPANPCVAKVTFAAGSGRVTPLALARRETISATWISPVLPMGISMVRVSNVSADAVPIKRAIHKQFMVLVCIIRKSGLGGELESTTVLRISARLIRYVAGARDDLLLP